MIDRFRVRFVQHSQRAPCCL